MEKSILVIQTCDPIEYLPLFETTSPNIRAYCDRHGYAYESFIGIKRGFTARHAAFNRIYLLQDAIRKSQYDWVLYLDVDCYVVDLTMPVDTILNENRDKAFIFCRGKRDGKLDDFNNGAFFVQIKHPETPTVISQWQSRFESVWTEKKLQEWTAWAHGPLLKAPGDQRLLHWIIGERLEKGEDVASWLRVYDGAEWQKFNYSGPFIRQCLRATGFDIQARVAFIQEEMIVRGIKNPR